MACICFYPVNGAPTTSGWYIKIILGLAQVPGRRQTTNASQTAPPSVRNTKDYYQHRSLPLSHRRTGQTRIIDSRRRVDILVIPFVYFVKIFQAVAASLVRTRLRIQQVYIGQTKNIDLAASAGPTLLILFKIGVYFRKFQPYSLDKLASP